MRTDKLTYYAFLFVLPIYMVYCYLFMRGYNYHTYIMGPTLVVLMFCALKLIAKAKQITIIKLANIFLVYSLLSVVMYMVNGAPINCYLRSIPFTIFPYLFIYFGYGYSNDNKWYKVLIWSALICLLLGLYLYFYTPSYYVNYVAERAEYSKMDSDSLRAILEFCSFLPSTYHVAFIAIPAQALSLSYTTKKDIGIKPIFLYLTAGVSFISAILCQRRIAIFFALFVVVMYVFHNARNNKSSNTNVIPRIVAFTFVAIVVLLLVNTFMRIDSESGGTLKDNILDRFMNMTFSQAYSERTSQFETFSRATPLSYLLGLGMGSVGHLAGEAGVQSITDGQYYCWFYEYGLLGFSIFILMMVITLIRCYNYRKLFWPESMIIIFFLGACVGFDPFDNYVTICVFWYTVGRVWNPVLTHKMQEEYLTRR